MIATHMYGQQGGDDANIALFVPMKSHNVMHCTCKCVTCADWTQEISMT